MDPNGAKDRPFNPSCDKPISIQPGTATPIKAFEFGIIIFYKKQSIKNAYNCHSYAWHNSQGDPTPQNGDLPSTPLFGDNLNRWDNNPADDIKEQHARQLSNNENNITGDRLIYYTDSNNNSIYDDGELITHSAVVSTVDKDGYTITVTAKLGQDGISENHPDAPGYYKIDENGNQTSRAYFRLTEQK